MLEVFVVSFAIFFVLLPFIFDKIIIFLSQIKEIIITEKIII